MAVEAGYARVNGTRLYYEVAGHLSNMESPAAFNEAVRQFLAGLDGAPPTG